MKKTFFKNLFRDIKKTLSRFLSIVIITALGVSFYAGVRATSPDMKMSGDYYFNKNNFMNFKVISTLGITKDDISEIGKLKGITKAEGSYSMDGVIEKHNRSIVININSLPDKNGMNRINILKGRAAKNDGEAVVEEIFLENHKLNIGDIIVIKSGNNSDVRDNLKNNKFKIVGTAQSPIYISAQRQISSVGDGDVSGFVYIIPEVFKSDIYTEMYVACDSEESKASLLNNESYKNVTSGIEKDLKDIGVKRNEIRYEQVLKDANDKIDEAEAKLDNSRKEAADKIAEGRKQLEDAKLKLENGKTELQKNQVTFNQKISNAEKQIYDGKSEIKATENKINLNADNQQTDTDISKEMEAKLAAGRAEIEANKKKLAESEVELNKNRKEGIIKLNEAKAQLEEAQKVIDDNTQKLNSEESKANSQFKEAEVKIQNNRDKIKDIKNPKWYVLGRSFNVGYENYRQDSDRIDNIGKVFPLIFFLVAALVSLTTMTRMVQENRTEIGTFKALGYSRPAIVSHYLIYSFLASVIGSVIGISFGFRLFPPLIMNAYSSLYAIHDYVIPFNIKLAVEASLIAILFTILAAIGATLGELREVPASLMRPKPPKSGKVILLERISFLWKRLSFTKKVTARNIFRYKQRFFMTVIGIAACTGLMITGFGLKEGITGAMNKQFTEIYKYDMQASLTKNIDNAEENSMNNKIIKDKNMKSILFTYLKNASVNKEKSGSEDVYVVVPNNKNNLNKYIALNMKDNTLKLKDDGVIITEKLSKLINKKTGDNFQITINDKVINAKISAITEQYVQHYIYISPSYYEKIIGERVRFNSFYGILNNTSESSQNNTSKTLSSIEGVNSVSFKNKIQVSFDKSMDSINPAVVVMIVSAGILAFVVIYNLTNININERKRELATIKLLGFYNNELAFYIYRENIILTVIGSLAGIVYGIFINRLIVSTAETNVMMFLKTINSIYFLYAAALTILFSLIVNLAMYRRFDKIDMIESLKNAE